MLNAHAAGADANDAVLVGSDLTAAEVEVFWRDVVPALAPVPDATIGKLFAQSEALHERFGTPRMRRFERLLERFSLMLRERVGPCAYGDAEPSIPKMSHYRLCLVINTIVLDGEAAYRAALDAPFQVGDRAASARDIDVIRGQIVFRPRMMDFLIRSQRVNLKVMRKPEYRCRVFGSSSTCSSPTSQRESFGGPNGRSPSRATSSSKASALTRSQMSRDRRWLLRRFSERRPTLPPRPIPRGFAHRACTNVARVAYLFASPLPRRHESMSEKEPQREPKAKRLTAPWSSGDLAWALGLSLPLLLYALELKLLRVLHRGVPLGPLSVLGLFASDVLATLGWLLVSLAVLLVCQGKWPRRLGRSTLRLAALLGATLLLGGHGYFMSSGTSLDWPLLRFSLVHVDEMGKVIGSARSPVRVFLFSLVAVSIVFLPIVAERAFAGRAGASLAAARRAGWFAATGAAAGLLMLLALRVDSVHGRDLSRDTVLNILATMGVAAEDDAEAIARAESWPRGPQRLVATDKTRAKNVFVILLESTGAWATSLYGGKNDTTKTLSMLAKKSLVAEHMRAVMPHTTKALTATFCGVMPRPSVGAPEALPAGIPARCLPALVADHGYDTMFLQSATHEFENRTQLTENMGFDQFKSGDDLNARGFRLSNYFGYEDKILLAPLDAFFTEQKKRGRPFFLGMLTNTPHHDYRPSFGYPRTHFVDDKIEDRYLNAVRYDDFLIRDIVELLRRHGLLDNTILVIMAATARASGSTGVSRTTTSFTKRACAFLSHLRRSGRPSCLKDSRRFHRARHRPDHRGPARARP